MIGNPIYRPMWWLSPSDPLTFTIDDQFLIGDEVTSTSLMEGNWVSIFSTRCTLHSDGEQTVPSDNLMSFE